jgi:hypothetical protein
MTGIVEMGTYLQNLIESNKASLGVQDVYYGDQANIPRTPTVCMEPGEKTRSPNGVPRRTLVTITNYLIVYHSEVASMQTVRLEDDQLAEAIETLVHTDATMGGLVIDSLVASVESGYLQRARAMFRASRLTVSATVQEQLPTNY